MSETGERRGQRYTIDQLKILKQSPLVQKPDGLPSIAQWMEVAPDPNTNRRRSGAARDMDVPLIGEGRNERPILNAAMGHFGRRTSIHPEDTVLGPPKLAFTSASRNAKAAEASDKRTVLSADGDTTSIDRFPARERWSRDREGDRVREKPTYQNGRRAGREEGEGWTNVKSRKSLGQDDFDRGFRNGDRERDRYHKEVEENGDVPQRRTAINRDKFESRWGPRRDESGSKDTEGIKLGGEGRGWRERERNRDRDRDQEWTRGGNKVEADPEWMDSPATGEPKVAHTQEDFQKWKESMAKSHRAEQPAQEKSEPLPSADQPASVPSVTTTSVPKLGTPLPNLEGGHDNLFGMWGKDKPLDSTIDAPTPIKSKAKPKSSRFATLFAPTDEAMKAPQSTVQVPAPPADSNTTNDEDKEGFKRILAMLGKSNISDTTNTQPSTQLPIHDSRHSGIGLDFQSPPSETSPDALLLRQAPPRPFEGHNLLDTILSPQPSGPETRQPQGLFHPMSPDAEAGPDQFRAPRPESNRPVDDFPIQKPPSRNASAQGALNLQAVLSNRVNQEMNRNDKQREREFLLNLMQSRSSPAHMANQNLPRPPPENQNLPPFFDINPQKATMQKGRGMPPGFIDEPRIYDQDLIRREAEQRQQASLREALLRDQGMQQPEHMRKPNQRPPPGIFDDPAIASLQRRPTGEIPRQMTNLGIPSQPDPAIAYMRATGMPQPPQERNIPPPPGFGGPSGMRQPPGFGGPQQPMGPLSGPNTPFGHPNMGPPPRPMGAMFPNQGQNPMPPPGPPQGYFPPPGFGPPMPGIGNRADDPRMMMGRPEFEQQFGGPNQNRPGGRPPGMYMQ